MSDRPTTNDQGVSLDRTTISTVNAYNGGGPPECAGLTHDGKPVPGFQAMGPSVQHKWTVASSVAAMTGADFVIGLVKTGQHDPAKLRAAVEHVFAAPAWVPTIRYEAELLAKGYEQKTTDGRALAMARELRDVAVLPVVEREPALFFAAGLRALVERQEDDEPAPPDPKDAAAVKAASQAKASRAAAAARTAMLREWLEAWPSKETVPLAGAVTVWRMIVTGLQYMHDRAPSAEARTRVAAMLATYRAEADYLEQLVS